MHAKNILCYTRYSVVQKLSNKQNAKVIYRFDRLRTSYGKRQKAIWALEKLLSTHEFDYILLRVKSGLIRLKLLPLMYIIELADIMFFIKGLKTPTSNFNGLTLPDHFFPFVLVVAEKGSGDIASIEWCSDTFAL